MSFLDGVLTCLDCRALLPPEASWPSDAIVCSGCKRSYPRLRGVPRFVSSDKYVSNFSMQWNTYSRTALDNETSKQSEETLLLKTGLKPEDVKGKRILDVGCGMGRFCDVVSRWGGEIVGVDLSLAVEAAYTNVGSRANVRILQADVFQLPFAPESFDIIFSIGVLHHTPDCKRAFESLVPFVKRGGTIAIWVYAHLGLSSHCSDFMRIFTTRMPQPLLHRLCQIASPLYPLYKVPGLGMALQVALPISMHPDPEWRALDTFDWYAPQYQSKHTNPEVVAWFKSAGLQQVETLQFPVSVRGVRP